MAITAERPVDLAHLDRYTGGSRALNEEILRLFDAQCREMLLRLEALAAEGDAKSWRETAHTLKGSAKGVGAFALADAAAAAEAANPRDASAVLAALHLIRNRSRAVELFIRTFLGR